MSDSPAQPVPQVKAEPSMNSMDSETEDKQWQSAEEFEKWIEHFYKECGREVTLAYTTLNQMKNWAMVIVAAFISAVVALNKTDPSNIQEGKPFVTIAIMVVAVIAYVFSLRFFVRAILCYINLIRWNTLQSDIVSYKILARPVGGNQNLDKEQHRQKILDDIVEYYHYWASPIDRKTQLISNLKLGFALVLALPLFFIVVGIVQLWGSYLARGLIAFAIGSSIVELNDFMRSTFFDTPKARQKRKETKRKRSNIFPIPVPQMDYLVLWALTLLISAGLALWPQIKDALYRILSCG